MVVVLILVSVAFLVTLGILLFGQKNAASAPSARLVEDSGRARQLESELDKKKKELEEQRKQLADANAELKQAKRKLYEQKEADKEDRDLKKARVEVERNASMQLEVVRGELAAALTEIDRLKNDGKGGRRPAPVVPLPSPSEAAVESTSPAAAPVAAAPVSAPAPEQRPQRVIRELSEADKEKMDRHERDAKKAREKAQELERELRRVKMKAETQNRIYVVTKGELDLMKDKFKALEKRMNRGFLENDLLKRAIKDLEKKTGIAAERTELSADEVAASDKQVEERVNAEAVKDAERHAAHLAAAEQAGRAAEEALKAQESQPQPESQPSTGTAAASTESATQPETAQPQSESTPTPPTQA